MTPGQYAAVQNHFLRAFPNEGTLEEFTRREQEVLNRCFDTTVERNDAGVDGGARWPPRADEQAENEDSATEADPAAERPPQKRARKANSKYQKQ